MKANLGYLCAILVGAWLTLGCRPMAVENGRSQDDTEAPASSLPGTAATLDAEPTQLARVRTDAPAELPIAAGTAPSSGQLMSLDPRQDGWSSEFFNEQAGEQLKRLAHWLHDRSDDAALSALLTDAFSCGPLVPQQAEQIFQVTDYHVETTATWPDAETHLGVAGFQAALHQLLGQEPVDDVHAKFKIVRVLEDYASGQVRTEQLAALSFVAEGKIVECHAMWVIDWQCRSIHDQPRLARLKARDYERVTRSSPRSVFSDRTSNVVHPASAAIWVGQYGVGVAELTRTRESFVGIDQFGHHGLAVGDANGDGWDDVYSCQIGGSPNRLWISQPDATVRDGAAEAGVDFLDNTRSALFVDLDNDGDHDLVVATSAALLILDNDGSGRFTIGARLTEASQTFSLSAADYDRDGDLDLYTCTYYADRATMTELPIPMPIYNANNGGRNLLLRNDGGGRFTDATSESGLDANNSRFSYASLWDDYDNDGDVDLFVANDFGRNNLYRNDGGHFLDVTDDVGMTDDAFGMSASSADFNRDGWVDYYKANMFSSAGNRVTHQQQFMTGASDDHRQRMQHLARGNTLFENHAGKFHDVSQPQGVTMGRWSWGSVFLDFNNDGWEDLYVTNGFVTGFDSGDL